MSKERLMNSNYLLNKLYEKIAYKKSNLWIASKKC